MTDDGDETFAIPRRPRRRYPRRGGVEHEGGTAFSLSPDDGAADGELDELVVGVLESGPYCFGDWFDLPMPLYLVHDDDSGDTFRIAVRDGAVVLYVLPDTESTGLRALYRRLDAASSTGWTVRRHVE